MRHKTRISREQWTVTLEAKDMPAPGSLTPFEEMEEGCNSGWIDFGTPGGRQGHSRPGLPGDQKA